MGSTPPLSFLPLSVSAHPHVCGEHPPFTAARVQKVGSSPRVWGALVDFLARNVAHRLIPTCVGSTHQGNLCPATTQAHPHVCGEHSQSLRAKVVKDGSSPRVWGAPARMKAISPVSRLIPTCVGSTSLAAPAHAPASAHPHVCGEHRWVFPLSLMTHGSSPRVWGAPVPRGLENE